MRVSRASHAPSGPRPTVRGWGLGIAGIVAMAGAAWLGRVDLLFIGIFLSCLPIASMLVLALYRPSLSVSRSFGSDVIAAGDDVEVVLNVRNLSSWPTPVLSWQDTAHAGLRVPRPEPFPWISGYDSRRRGGQDTIVLRYHVRAEHRGLYEVGPLILRGNDPFGIAHVAYTSGVTKILVATPRISLFYAGGIDSTTQEGLERELLHQSVPNADELIAREYRTGDPLRRVHWKATARHDTLMVRQEEQRSSPNAWILFDDVRPVQHEKTRSRFFGRSVVFEQAVELMASLGSHLIDAGFSINIVETARAQSEERYSALAGTTSQLDTAAVTFERAIGARSLMISLATVRQRYQERGRYASSLTDGTRQGPVVPAFLILTSGELTDLESVALLRPRCEPAIAFLCGSKTQSAAGVLASEGWLCVPVRDGDNPASAWARAVQLYDDRALFHG